LNCKPWMIGVRVIYVANSSLRKLRQTGSDAKHKRAEVTQSGNTQSGKRPNRTHNLKKKSLDLPNVYDMLTEMEDNLMIFCSICDNEATHMVKETKTPLCASCATAYEWGCANKGSLLTVDLDEDLEFDLDIKLEEEI